MMTLSDYNKLKHFKAEEFENPALMNSILLEKLDHLRDYLGQKIIVTSSTGGTHREGSEHYKGNAVDILIPQNNLSLLSLYFIIERFGFNGIGIYPDWHYDNVVYGGFHLDMRELTPETGLYGKRWLGKKELRDSVEPKTYYYALNPKNLFQLKILTCPKEKRYE